MQLIISIVALVILLALVSLWLRNQFNELARKALQNTSEEFLRLATEKLSTERTRGVAELEQKKQAVDNAVKGLEDQLERYEKLVKGFETDRERKYGALENELGRAITETGKLQRTTANLAAVLGNVKVRGQWGQKMADDILRFCGLQEGVHYLKEKETIAGRPDYTFLLPEGPRLFMDAKFPLDNYLKLTRTEPEEEQKFYREEFTKDVRAHLREMEKRGYANSNDESLDYILIFIPNEQVYGLINEWMPGLLDECLQKRIILCGPWTLYAIVRIIFQAWQNYHYSIAIRDIVKATNGFMQDYNIFKERFGNIGASLDKAAEAYQDIKNKSYKRLDNRIQKIEEYRKGQGIPEALQEPEEVASGHISSEEGKA